jgi:phage/plasmid primase-like uncharacterized protein
MTLPGEMIERARGVPIMDVVAASGIKLGRAGRELVGACPVCGGTDRFSIHPTKNAFNCRVCKAGGHDAIALAMHLYGIDFRAAVEILTGAPPGYDRRRPVRQARQATSTRESDDSAMLGRAVDIWRAAVPIAGTDGAAYLASRGIAMDEVPDHGGLRFHHACPYGRDGTVPAVVARYSDIVTGMPRGIHRRAIVTGTTPKTMSLGPVRGAAVRLWPDEDVTQGLVIGEGIETVLAAATRIEHRGTLLRPAWACSSAGNLEDFPVLPGIEALTILADADASGRGQEAAERCAERWADAGREVTILTPRDLGADMNDVVRAA